MSVSGQPTQVTGQTLEGLETPITVDQDQNLRARDSESAGLLREILVELKKITLLLSHIADTDVEGGYHGS